MPRSEVLALGKGVGRALRACGIPLIGGDTKESEALVLCGTAIGEAEPGRTWKRGNARLNDDIFLSGAIGGVSAAAWLLKNCANSLPTSIRRQAGRALTRPNLQLRLAGTLRALNNRIAAIDLSDGLALDASRLAAASGVGIEIEADLLPLDPLAGFAALSSGVEAWKFGLGIGGDCQFLFCSAKTLRHRVEELGCIRIGRVRSAGDGSCVRVGSRCEKLGDFGHKDFEPQSMLQRLEARIRKMA
jgi:thiamine-monophosphate kinase